MIAFPEILLHMKRYVTLLSTYRHALLPLLLKRNARNRVPFVQSVPTSPAQRTKPTPADSLSLLLYSLRIIARNSSSNLETITSAQRWHGTRGPLDIDF